MCRLARVPRHPGLAFALLAVLASTLTSGCDTAPKPQSSPMTLFLEQDVPDEQIAAIEQHLRGMPTARDVTFQNKDEAYEDFKRKFSKAPNLVASTQPGTIPASLSATVDSDLVEVIETAMASVPGVHDVAVSMPSGTQPRTELGMVVQTSPEVTDSQRQVIAAYLQTLPGAKPATFEPADAAHTRLRQRCKDRPNMARLVDAAPAFASYRFTFAVPSDPVDPEYLRLDQLPGVAGTLSLPRSAM